VATVDHVTFVTELRQPCAWCGSAVVTRLGDRDLRAAIVNMRTFVIRQLELDRDRHLTGKHCATAGHDAGDEDPGEHDARLDWRPAP
jgi:hypothetical protein